MSKLLEIKCCADCGFNENFEDEYCLVHKVFMLNAISTPLLDLTEIDTSKEIHPECPLDDFPVLHERVKAIVQEVGSVMFHLSDEDMIGDKGLEELGLMGIKMIMNGDFKNIGV